MKDKIFIYGAGGFGREVVDLVRDVYNLTEEELISKVSFIDSNESLLGKVVGGISVISSIDFRIDMGVVIIAIGDSKIRRQIVDQLPDDTRYITLIHPNVKVGRNSSIGLGSIICAGSIITCDVVVGEHAHLNLTTTIGHDTVIKDFFTSAPAVNISGECVLGECVYFGTQSSIRQGLSVVENSIIGMGAVVVTSIQEPGVYIGSPARKLN